MTTTEAHAKLKGSFAKDKNEILYGQFGINYNDIEDIYKKGTTLIRMLNPKDKKHKKPKEEEKTDQLTEDMDKMKLQKEIIRVHEDMVEKNEFYVKYDLYDKLK